MFFLTADKVEVNFPRPSNNYPSSCEFGQFFVKNLGWELFGVAMAYNCTFAVMFLSLLFFSYSNEEIRLTHVKPNFNLFEDLPAHFV